MQLGETHIPKCHDKQRGCVSMLFFLSLFLWTTVRCVASVWGEKQQVQVASKEGAPLAEDFCGNTRQGGAKSNGKKTKQKGNKTRKRNQCVQRQIKLKKGKKQQTSHLFTLSDREQTKTGWVGHK